MGPVVEDAFVCVCVSERERETPEFGNQRTAREREKRFLELLYARKWNLVEN